ncbi:predicted protein [Sclerotinia sclerotiorum 1980 UF-70]|uniref:Uncharacterized protein n=1 Tax=Sclerotinia sclerotiorum (strain ATCC 18683 / 1980 / Ss-1) TaxID=665079 RepID=A7F025_SCLS1|nr:predicted protein [Sclerotinia sclerotiorum 1980 UF-70]EDN95067.1 predicted protein [Sclerotinia sclerotiorum 1980 UF-70]
MILRLLAALGISAARNTPRTPFVLESCFALADVSLALGMEDVEEISRSITMYSRNTSIIANEPSK